MPSEVQEFVLWFAEEYRQRLTGNPSYFINWPKDAKLVKQLVGHYGTDRLKQLAVMMLESDEPFIEMTARDIGVLVMKANWLEARLRAAEAKQAPRLRSVK